MIKKVAPDKWKHFYTGIFMGIILQAFSSFLIKDHLGLATVIAFIVVIGVSYGFELFSKFSGLGHYDFIDAVASAIGGVIGMALALLFEQFVVN